jgi:hypothetical protein
MVVTLDRRIGSCPMSLCFLIFVKYLTFYLANPSLRQGDKLTQFLAFFATRKTLNLIFCDMVELIAQHTYMYLHGVLIT